MEKTRIYKKIPKINRHNLPKYTKINKPNNNWYILGIILNYFSIRGAFEIEKRPMLLVYYIVSLVVLCPNQKKN
jgi:hypothetical protein